MVVIYSGLVLSGVMCSCRGIVKCSFPSPCRCCRPLCIAYARSARRTCVCLCMFTYFIRVQYSVRPHYFSHSSVLAVGVLAFGMFSCSVCVLCVMRRRDAETNTRHSPGGWLSFYFKIISHLDEEDNSESFHRHRWRRRRRRRWCRR